MTPSDRLVEQIKAARGLLGWSIATLARESKRTYSTIAKAETGRLDPRHRDSTLADIKATLEAAGVQFVPETDKGPGVTLQEPKA